MKVSERIKLLREVLKRGIIDTMGRSAMESQLIQLEVDIVAMVMKARFEGYKAGFADGLAYARGEND